MSAVAAPRVDAAPCRALSAIALVAILCASGAAEIVWRAGLGGRPTLWAQAAQVGVLLFLLGLVRTWRPARPLIPLVSALAALAGGFLVLFLVERATGFTAWTDSAPSYQVIPAESALLCLPTLLMLGVAFAFGFDRRRLFLARGDVAAPSRVPGTSRRVTWRRLGPVTMLVFAVPLCVQLALTTETDVHRLALAAELLPLAIAFAAVNAAQEELRFRAVPLALALPVLGAERGIWLTATAFGLAHWYGHPHGPSGVALTFFAGLILAKAMVETRGFLWPWAIHAAQDVVIFVFLVLASS